MPYALTAVHCGPIMWKQCGKQFMLYCIAEQQNDM